MHMPGGFAGLAFRLACSVQGEENLPFGCTPKRTSKKGGETTYFRQKPVLGGGLTTSPAGMRKMEYV